MKTPPLRAPSRRDVLVVDDSALARQALKAIIEEDPAFRVAFAGDPYEAVESLARSAPAAIVLDVEMPRMDGLTFLKKLMRQHPLPVLVCTDHVQRGLAALDLRALEVIAKPNWDDDAGLARWGAHLRESLRLATGLPPIPEGLRPAGLLRDPIAPVLPHQPYQARGAPAGRVVAIGASTGGVQAIQNLLADFPADSPGIVIVQHIPANFNTAFAERLDRDPAIAMKVAEAKPNEPIRPGVALVVPGGIHGLLRRAGAGYRIELVDGPKISGFCPSVDVLFRSAAQAAGPRVAGVLLTGMLCDGAHGLADVREAGGWTIAQDQATSVVFGMPGEAIRRGAARQVLPLDRIAAAVMAWSKGSSA